MACFFGGVPSESYLMLRELLRKKRRLSLLQRQRVISSGSLIMCLMSLKKNMIRPCKYFVNSREAYNASCFLAERKNYLFLEFS